MGQVTINDEYLTSIADSIRLMKQTTNRITTDSMAGEIRDIQIGWDPGATWTRPIAWPDYSAIDISDFEGMYFTYDRTSYDPWIGINVTVAGGYCVERGYIENGEFIIEETTNVASAASYLHPIPSGVYDYVVYRVTPQVAGNHITAIGQVAQTATLFGGKMATYWSQPVLERYGRLPHLTTFSQWVNTGVVSDTILDMGAVTTLNSVWNTCYKLENINLSGFIAHPTSCYQTFRYCHKLQFVTTANLVTSSCTSIASMFQQAHVIPYIDTTGWDTSNVTSFASAFESCLNLYKLDVSHFNTEKVTSMGSMFYNCNKLETIDVSGFDTAKVTSMASMFRSCHRVKTLELNNFDTSNVTSISYMFSSAYSLTNMDVSGFVTPKLTNTSYAFSYLRHVKELDLSGWDVSKVTDASYMFEYCTGLERLNLSGWTMSAVTTMRSMFDCCSSLEEINTTGMTVANTLKASNCLNSTFTSVNKVRVLDLSGWNLSALPANYASVFRYCYCLEKIILPATIKGIAATFFGNCQCLQEIVLPNQTLVPLTNTNAFGSTPTNKVIYVPDELVEEYDAATNWKSVACVFKGLSEYNQN